MYFTGYSQIEISMNYLAHLFLSGDDEFIKIGNFIADHIKGNKYQLFPENIQKGILLHRQIDSFTDQHAIVRQSKKRLNVRYGHYKGVIIDIFYDHFLAKNWSHYADGSLKDFTRSFYSSLQKNIEFLPERTRFMMPYMIRSDWITNYANLRGIEDVLIGMNKRTKERGHLHLSIEDLNLYYKEFEADFTHFFQDLIDFSSIKLAEINRKFLNKT